MQIIDFKVFIKMHVFKYNLDTSFMVMAIEQIVIKP